jgi:dTDP-D-glucose 4,6-dehydratase
MAPFKFIDRVFRGEPIQQYGDGTTSRDYTYIDDIVEGVVSAVDRPLGYEVINLGNGRPFRLKDFISLVEKCVGRSANIEVLPEQPGDVERTCADISKARELLGYDPKVAFEDGISRTADWYRAANQQGLFEEVVGDEEAESGAVDSEQRHVDRQLSSDSTSSRSSWHHRLQRDDSDLELSSYVQKASKQVKERSKRVF